MKLLVCFVSQPKEPRTGKTIVESYGMVPGRLVQGNLLFGLGILFVHPYYKATKAELYAAMRAKVLASGYVTEAELSGQIF